MSSVHRHVLSPDRTAPIVGSGAGTWVILLASLSWLGVPCGGAEPGAASQKPDWVGLDSLIAAGEYEKAVSVAGGIATQLEPNRRDPDFVVRSIGFVRATMRRGLAELKLGRLDDAADSFEEAYRALKDSNFRRLVAIEARNPNAQVLNNVILLDLTMVELLELRMAVLVDRLRFLNLGIAPPGATLTDDETELRAVVATWLKDLAYLERSADESRKALGERFDQAGQAVLASPHYRSLVGSFRPSMLAAAKALEIGRLKVTPVGEDGENSSPDPGRADGEAALAEAKRCFQEASTALTEAIEAAAPKGDAAMKPAERIEAALLRRVAYRRRGDAACRWRSSRRSGLPRTSD